MNVWDRIALGCCVLGFVVLVVIILMHLGVIPS
jgi:hypothetical protein